MDARHFQKHTWRRACTQHYLRRQGYVSYLHQVLCITCRRSVPSRRARGLLLKVISKKKVGSLALFALCAFFFTLFFDHTLSFLRAFCKRTHTKQHTHDLSSPFWLHVANAPPLSSKAPPVADVTDTFTNGIVGSRARPLSRRHDRPRTRTVIEPFFFFRLLSRVLE